MASGSAGSHGDHQLLKERALALEEALRREVSSGGTSARSVGTGHAKSGAGAESATPPKASMSGFSKPSRVSTDPSGQPWTPLVPGGVSALLQLSTAPGAHVRMRGQGVEFHAQPTLLFDHLADLLQEHLARHPWYAEPLRIAAARARQHLKSPKLRVSTAVKITAVVEGEECHVTVEGVPEEAEVAAQSGGEEGQHDIPHAEGPDAPLVGGICGNFQNEFNLQDTYEDVLDIYQSFTDHLASQSATPLHLRNLQIS